MFGDGFLVKWKGWKLRGSWLGGKWELEESKWRYKCRRLFFNFSSEGKRVSTM